MFSRLPRRAFAASAVAGHRRRRTCFEKILLKTYEHAPENFEALLGIEGVGPKTLRALALASELVHGTPATLRDPARFSFAHGGKDGTPFPVDKLTYDRTIDILNKAINRAAIDRSDRVSAFKRLARFAGAEQKGDLESRPTLLIPNS